MSFSIGPSSLGMGPRSALDQFGNIQKQDGAVHNPHLFKRLLKYLRPYKWKMIAAFALTLCESGLTLLTPYLIKVAIDEYITVKRTEGFLNIGLIILIVFIATFFVSAGQRLFDLFGWSKIIGFFAPGFIHPSAKITPGIS